jgi:hypothetical protein
VGAISGVPIVGHELIILRVVEQNLTTAFILEDDVDWDIRVRQSLQRFAIASRILSSSRDLFATSPHLKSHVEYRDNTETEESAFQIIDTKNLPKSIPSLPLATVRIGTDRNQQSRNNEDRVSPYGDPSKWDILIILPSRPPTSF